MKFSGVLCCLSVAWTAPIASAFVMNRSCRLQESCPIAAIQEETDIGEGASTTTKATIKKYHSVATRYAQLAMASAVSLSIVFSTTTMAAQADGQTERFRLPPIDLSDKNRCKLNSSTIGQANAARDKLYDLRQCQLSGASAPGFDLSGVIMTKTDLSKANFQDAYFSKGYLQGMCVSHGFWFLSYKKCILYGWRVFLSFLFLQHRL